MQVDLIAHTVFDYDWAPNPEWEQEVNSRDAELLVEFAGRNCYQSWNNPGKKTNAEYIRHILECGHGSVLEHASATFYITGVSRSLTHELIRHRHLSFSELSQRYVNVEDAEFVCPPAIENNTGATLVLVSDYESSKRNYKRIVDNLTLQGLPRKKAREAARCIMPNCVETKIVVTGNFRAWRYFIGERASEGADAEIRRLAVEICRQLRERFPAVFCDLVEYQMDDGEIAVRTEQQRRI